MDKTCAWITKKNTFTFCCGWKELFRLQSRRKKPEGGKKKGWKIESQTEKQVQGLYTYLQELSTTQYNQKRKGDSILYPLQNKSQSILCVYFTVHIYTRSKQMGSGWVHVIGYGLQMVIQYGLHIEERRESISAYRRSKITTTWHAPFQIRQQLFSSFQ